MINIVPINDLKEHTEDKDCWCIPIVDDGSRVERAIEKVNSMTPQEFEDFIIRNDPLYKEEK